MAVRLTAGSRMPTARTHERLSSHAPPSAHSRKRSTSPAPPPVHHPALGRQTVTEVVGAGHLPHRLLTQRDRLQISALEQPAPQGLSSWRRAAHPDKVQERSRAEEVQVVGVVVIVSWRGPRRIAQLGPAAPDARDPLPVEAGHQLGAVHAPPRDAVPGDEEHKGDDRGRHECPCRRALPRREEPPRAHDGGREHPQTKAAVKSHGAESFSRLPVEAVGSFPVESGGVGGWRVAVLMSRFHA